MVKLLDCQKNEDQFYDKESLKAFAISMLCELLDIFEIDISAEEMRDIELFVKDWCKE